MLTTRFAPSPTGRLHLGHAYSAVVGRQLAGEGRFLLRIEDLDQTRSRAEFGSGIIEDLRWLGIDWNGPVLVQSERAHVYAEALAALREMGLVYPCFCTRADIAAALSAPHDSVAGYPGICRGLPNDPGLRVSRPHSWRLDSARAVAMTGMPGWTESDGRRWTADAAQIGDEILARKDAPAAYHLACVVDDAASGVTMVVRGADLRASTPVQRLLQMLLGLAEPGYCHHALVTHEDGRRLAKRDRAPTLAAMRAAGVDGRALGRQLATGFLPSGFRFGGS